MLSKLKFLFKHRAASKFALGSLYDGYLKDVGWLRSFEAGFATSASGEPVPWLSYPAVEFLNERLVTDCSVFEYGSGASTLYFSRRVKAVTGVEHNQDWFNHCVNHKPANARLYFIPQNKLREYADSVKIEGLLYDLILVDGINRIECSASAVSSLTERGVLILDDTERPEYQIVLDRLKNAGFKSLPFWGTAALIRYRKCTTIFYRPDNLLGI